MVSPISATNGKIIDDSDNNEGFINTYEDSVILRSINNILTINTEYLGVNNIEL